MRYFSREPFRQIPSEAETSDSPELGQSIVVDKREVLNLTVETGDETELGFCPSVCLFLANNQKINPIQSSTVEGNHT